jgi:hypothetical protein
MLTGHHLSGLQRSPDPFHISSLPIPRTVITSLISTLWSTGGKLFVIPHSYYLNTNALVSPQTAASALTSPQRDRIRLSYLQHRLLKLMDPLQFQVSAHSHGCRGFLPRWTAGRRGI